MSKTIAVLKKHGLTLEAEPTDEGRVDVWVTDHRKNASASAACAQFEGYLTCNRTYEDVPLTDKQNEWLDSDEVMEWLEKVGY